MGTLHLLQHPEVIQGKQQGRDDHDGARNDGADLGRRVPDAVLLRVDVDERRDQTREGVQAAGSVSRALVSAWNFHVCIRLEK